MYAYVFSGNLGVGKTLGMSILALYFSSKSGCSLYSNYGLNFAKTFNHYEGFLDIAVQPHSIVCLDESHVDLDARNSNSNTVKYFSQLLFYLRKLRCTMMFTTPSIDNLDVRVRGITNIYVEVSKDKDRFYYDMYDLNSEKFLKRKIVEKNKAFGLASNIYSTEAMVTPMELPQDKVLFTEFLHRLEATHKRYTDSLKEATALAVGS